MEKAREDRLRVNVTLQVLGLTHVRDTYVGDHSVRGISGGQRRRVTVGKYHGQSEDQYPGDSRSYVAFHARRRQEK